MCVFLAHVQLFGVVATPPHFVSPVIPLSLLSTTGSEWVIQMLNSIILGIHPSALLWWVATLLCDQNPFNPAIRIIFSPGLYLISLTVSKTLLNINIHCFPLMHQTSLFFIGSYQLCQKWCLLPRLVLTTPTPCFSLFLQMISRIFLYSLSESEVRLTGLPSWRKNQHLLLPVLRSPHDIMTFQGLLCGLVVTTTRSLSTYSCIP